jgi:hypothetical protein
MVPWVINLFFVFSGKKITTTKHGVYAYIYAFIYSVIHDCVAESSLIEFNTFIPVNSHTHIHIHTGICRLYMVVLHITLSSNA